MEQFTVKTEDLCQLYDMKSSINIITLEGIVLTVQRFNIKNKKNWNEDIGQKNRQQRESGNIIIQDQKTKLIYTAQYDGVWEDDYLIFPYETSTFFLTK